MTEEPKPEAEAEAEGEEGEGEGEEMSESTLPTERSAAAIERLWGANPIECMRYLVGLQERDYATLLEQYNKVVADLKTERELQAKTLADVHLRKGTRVLRDLAENTERATKKHGTHANIMVTLGVLSQEMHELQEAVHSREERLIRAELLDVATSALRGVEALDERAEAQRKRMDPYARCKCSHMKANHYGESAGCMECDCSLYRQDT